MSLVLARDEELIAYGNTMANERLIEVIHRWIDLGMPAASVGVGCLTIACLRVTIGLWRRP